MKTFTFDKVLILLMGIILIPLNIALSNVVHQNNQEKSPSSIDVFTENSLEVYTEGISSDFQGFSFNKNFKQVIDFVQQRNLPKFKEKACFDLLAHYCFIPIYFIVLFIHAP